MCSEPVDEEQEFHRRLSARDSLVLADLYDEYSPTVFGVALQVTSSLNAAEAVTRSVFLDLWRRPSWWEPEHGPLRPWLATVARHRSMAWVRGGSVSGRVTDDFDLRPSGSPDAGSPHGGLNAERVRRELAGLPDAERTPILLAYFGGRSYREVADELGLPAAQVKLLIRAGLRRIDVALRERSARRLRIAHD